MPHYIAFWLTDKLGISLIADRVHSLRVFIKNRVRDRIDEVLPELQFQLHLLLDPAPNKYLIFQIPVDFLQFVGSLRHLLLKSTVRFPKLSKTGFQVACH